MSKQKDIVTLLKINRKVTKKLISTCLYSQKSKI